MTLRSLAPEASASAISPPQPNSLNSCPAQAGPPQQAISSLNLPQIPKNALKTALSLSGNLVSYTHIHLFGCKPLISPQNSSSYSLVDMQGFLSKI